jgi:hypothetical protein
LNGAKVWRKAAVCPLLDLLNIVTSASALKVCDFTRVALAGLKIVRGSFDDGAPFFSDPGRCRRCRDSLCLIARGCR